LPTTSADGVSTATRGIAAMARWMARFFVITRENCAVPRRQGRATARLP